MRKLTLVNRVDRSKTDGDISRPMCPNLSTLFGTDCGTVNEGGYPKPPPIKPTSGGFNGGKHGLNFPHDLATLIGLEAACLPHEEPASYFSRPHIPSASPIPGSSFPTPSTPGAYRTAAEYPEEPNAEPIPFNPRIKPPPPMIFIPDLDDPTFSIEHLIAPTTETPLGPTARPAISYSPPSSPGYFRAATPSHSPVPAKPSTGRLHIPRVFRHVGALFKSSNEQSPPKQKSGGRLSPEAAGDETKHRVRSPSVRDRAADWIAERKRKEEEERRREEKEPKNKEKGKGTKKG